MGKSILVIDTPEACCQCKFSGSDGDYCCIKENLVSSGNQISEEEYLNKKPDWCPLRDIPEKADHPDYCDNGRYDNGWNDCLDHILNGD